MTKKRKTTEHKAAAECDRCSFCAERGEQLLEMAVSLKLVDDNERDVEILDLIINLRHRYEQLPEAERIYETWENLIESTGIHYRAEVAGEDCDQDCERHAHLFYRDGDDEAAPTDCQEADYTASTKKAQTKRRKAVKK